MGDNPLPCQGIPFADLYRSVRVEDFQAVNREENLLFIPDFEVVAEGCLSDGHNLAAAVGARDFLPFVHRFRDQMLLNFVSGG